MCFDGGDMCQLLHALLFYVAADVAYPRESKLFLYIDSLYIYINEKTFVIEKETIVDNNASSGFKFDS